MTCSETAVDLQSKRLWAWGKVILLGEHSVVYGHQALAGAVDRGIQCRIVSEGTARLSVPAWDLEISADDSDNPASAAFAAVLAATGSKPISLQGETNLPCAAGLGSSAALCVAIARSIRPSASETEIASFANAGEQCFHKSPSGVDVALSLHGGVGVYSKATGLRPLQPAPLRLVIALSGIGRSTAVQVGKVSQRLREDPSAHAHIEELGRITEDGVIALEQTRLEELGRLMNRCHEHLCALGVSTPALDAMVAAAKSAGAIGAKLTGAGGGGAIICLAPSNEEKVCKSLQAQGFECFTAQMGVSP